MPTTYTSAQIITDAATDLGVQKFGQALTDDIYQGGFRLLNIDLDDLAQIRVPIWQGNAEPYSILSAFPNLTTAFGFAPGYIGLLRNRLAVALAPALKQYFKIPEPLIESLAGKADTALKELSGTAPVTTPVQVQGETTGQQMINDICVDLGVLRAGQCASSEISTILLRIGQQMLSGYLLDKFLVYAYVANTYPLIPTQQQYTIGPSGTDFIAPRPVDIEYANIILNTFNPVIRVPMAIIDAGQWANIGVQQLPDSIPNVLYYDKNFSSTGFGTINIWPGSLDGYLLEIYTWQQITTFPDLTTAIIYPPGYEEFIRKNWARMAIPAMKPYMKFGADLSMIIKEAARTRQIIAIANIKNDVLAGDAAFLGSGSRNGAWNYLSGTVGRNSP
jgi:hypothetical protein